MRDHFLAVRRGCGDGRVISLGEMAKDYRTAGLTLAHVALRLCFSGCYDGPDEVHLCATHSGLGPAPNSGISLVWTLPLIERPGDGAKRRRFVVD